MNQASVAVSDDRLHKIQQAVKWTVYLLLIINFVFYVFEDWNRALHTLTATSTFLDWTSEFATSIDESGWFLLLFMFELETYVIDDLDLKGRTARVIRGVRTFCYVLIAHTVYAMTVVVVELQPTVLVENVSDLCDMAGADVSYVYNLEYTEITESSCNGLSSATDYFWLADDPIVSDAAGLDLERDLAWADLAEVVIWLLILLAIEAVVRLQSHGTTSGSVISSANIVKLVLYASLLLIGIYWASLSHWLYLWDEIVWIGGFAAIEMNLSEWRDELDASVPESNAPGQTNSPTTYSG